MSSTVDDNPCYICWDTHSNFLNWEDKILTSKKVSAFYREHPLAASRIGLLASPFLGVATMISDPIRNLIGIIAFPILGIKDRNPAYIGATIKALFLAGLAAGYITLCIYVCTPTQSISLTVTIAVLYTANAYRKMRSKPENIINRSCWSLCTSLGSIGDSLDPKKLMTNT